MKGKKVSLCYTLLGAGLLMSLFSLALFPSRHLEVYSSENSKVCYDNYQFAVLPNTAEYRVVNGHGFNATLFGNSIMNIALEVKYDCLDFSVESRNVSIQSRYTMKGASFGFPYIYWLEFDSDWMTIENHNRISSLNVNHTITNGTWQYRLRFQNIDPQESRTVALSVVEYWQGVDFDDVDSPFCLIPFNFLYLGVVLLGIGSVSLIWGGFTKKFTQADLLEPIQQAFHNMRRMVGTKEVVFTIMFTVGLLFVSTFMTPTRLGVNHVLVDSELKKTFVRYSGFPLEMMGTITPITIDTWELMFAASRFYAGGHGVGMFDVQWQSITNQLIANVPESAPVVIVWDGLLSNIVLYSAFSFFLVIALSHLATRRELARYYSRKNV